MVTYAGATELMEHPSPYAAVFDASVREAVSAIDAGDVGTLTRLVTAESGAGAREAGVARSVAARCRRRGARRILPATLPTVVRGGDPVRNGRLPENIAVLARAIIDAARHEPTSNLQEQLDYALTLVSWSWIARQSGVQLELIDVLIDAGAALDGNPNNALVNGNVDAARHLVERGARLTLATALCLGLWDEVDRLLMTATDRQKQFSFVLSALNGRANALQRMIRAGVDINAPSQDLYAHGTPLHHAVCSGRLDAVQVTRGGRRRPEHQGHRLGRHALGVGRTLHRRRKARREQAIRRNRRVPFVQARTVAAAENVYVTSGVEAGNLSQASFDGHFTYTQSPMREFMLAGVSIVVAVATGMAWLGQPLRMVQLLTIIGLSMTAGVAWGRAVWRAREGRSGRSGDPAGSRPR